MRRFVPDLGVSEAQDGQARGGEPLVAEAISRLGGGGAVIAQPVGLDHQPEVRPDEVHAKAVDPLLGERRPESGAPHQWQEAPLELGVREREGRPVKQPS